MSELSAGASVTHSISYLNELHTEYLKLIDNFNDIIKKIEDVDDSEVDKEYSGKLREIYNDFFDKLDKKLKKLLFDYKILKEEFPVIKKNKNEEVVIYSLRRYLDIEKKYKKLVKKYNELDDDIVHKALEKRFDENYAINVAYNKILAKVLIIENSSEAILNALNDILGIDKDDD